MSRPTMAPHWLTALVRIGSMFAVMLLGYVACRRRFLSAETTQTLSRFVVDVTLPALIVDQMLTTVSPASLRTGFVVPLVAVLSFLVWAGLGALVAPLFAARAERPTFVFLVAIANWIYLPLPIAAGLFGDAGKLVVLLYNVGGVVMLWTLGVWTLRRTRPDAAALRSLIKNPGLLATVAGVALAVAFPALRGAANEGAPMPLLPVVVLLQALALVGSLTVPLSLLITGAQLAVMPASAPSQRAPLAGVLIARLVLAPAVVIALLAAARAMGLALEEPTRITLYVISGMPVAVSCAVFAERFGGDVPLTSRAIFYSTLASLLTTPAWLLLVDALGL